MAAGVLMFVYRKSSLFNALKLPKLRRKNDILLSTMNLSLFSPVFYCILKTINRTFSINNQKWQQPYDGYILVTSVTDQAMLWTLVKH